MKKKRRELKYVDIYDFGVFRIGLSPLEITNYLEERSGLRGNKLKRLEKEFHKAAGVNTMGLGPGGVLLMYRHDVQRFADCILLGTPTYWD